ncbi:MAG: hypothetical protein KAI24_04065 [Planctomycetes bacterium]|nr:hypothetical protein [Planctomycetota bacterium]
MKTAVSPTVLAALLCALAAPVGTAAAQQIDAATVERLRRDQDEILRKAERLQKLMTRLKVRYQREGKQEQVEYLTEGLAHLERSGILRDVASIRENIESTAFTEALRKQGEVVADLERLLNILLARKSIESLDDQIEQVAKQAQTAQQLEQRQRDLIEQARQTMQSELSPAEQQLADAIAAMRDAEQREADRNAQQAGTRRPFLESALRRVEQLLRAQAQLESGLEDEAAGRTPEARTEAFDLGDLSEKVRELQRDLKDQRQQRRLGAAGSELRQAAAANDAEALQQALLRLQRLLEDAPKKPGTVAGDFKARDEKWAEVRQDAQTAPDPDTAAGTEALGKVGEQAEQLAGQRDREAGEANQQASGKLADSAQRLAERLQGDARGQDGSRSPESGSPETGKPQTGEPRAGEPQTGEPQAGQPRPDETAADAVAQAAQKLTEAEAALAQGDAEQADRKVNEAVSALDKARSRHRRENPDAARNAGEMAAEARAAAQELANAPTQEDAERTAGTELQEASDALRDVGRKVDEARQQGQRPDAQQAAAESRQSLEAARDALQGALSQAAQNNQAELQAAQQRQQQLAQQAEQAQQQLQQAAQNGDINDKQQQAAQQAMQQAQQSMQQAQQQLQQGQQASAAQQQQQAAEQMQQAMDALQQNRELDQAQKDQLAQQAQQQEQLTEDIIRLAKELEERDNDAARRAVEEAADASKKAQRAMEEGDADEVEQQQEKAREKLQEAIDELEEEQDRYQDLRQEELLFRMKDELTAFLEKQRPITEQTRQFQASQNDGRLSRAARRKVNGLGEEEQALAGKIEFLVSALTEEGNLVYQSVLDANLEDLREVARRLAGRAPDVGSFTVLLQEDVERRTEQLLAALEREQKRREQERQEQQQQQNQEQPQNKFNQQRERLVSLIAELEMLKQLGQDTREATENLKTLVEVRGDETISEAEVAMIQRLAHRHNEITKLFVQIKAGVEEALNAMQGGEEEQQGSGR